MGVHITDSAFSSDTFPDARSLAVRVYQTFNTCIAEHVSGTERIHWTTGMTIGVTSFAHSVYALRLFPIAIAIISASDAAMAIWVS